MYFQYFYSEIACSGYLDIRLFYDSNYLNYKFNIHFSPILKHHSTADAIMVH